MSINYKNDERAVVTLDAGGTNMVFGAMQGCAFITEKVELPSNSKDLGGCLSTMVKGFEQVIKMLKKKPVAISFAFPGPADYTNGVIVGDLPNFPSFRRGVALGAYLEKKFSLPVFINNDGNLFAYGEARAGCLPWLNSEIECRGSEKRYNNLIGITIGTGFGCGIVINGRLLVGDNGIASYLWCARNNILPGLIAEEGVSIRAVQREYASLSGDERALTPKEIFHIAEGDESGDQEAAFKSFVELGRCAGQIMATACSIIDGAVVIGGGITGAAKYIMPSFMKELKACLTISDGRKIPVLQSDYIYMEGEKDLEFLASINPSELRVYDSDEIARYNSVRCNPVMLSMLGANEAISAGAYIFALENL